MGISYSRELHRLVEPNDHVDSEEGNQEAVFRSTGLCNPCRNRGTPKRRVFLNQKRDE